MKSDNSPSPAYHDLPTPNPQPCKLVGGIPHRICKFLDNMREIRIPEHILLCQFRRKSSSVSFDHMLIRIL